jgi:hypothetical protein
VYGCKGELPCQRGESGLQPGDSFDDMAPELTLPAFGTAPLVPFRDIVKILKLSSLRAGP